MVADPRSAAPFDAYVVLGLDQTASTDDVRRAYRRLARSLHPDANPADRAAEARFREVVEAYAVLGDPVRRLRYDRARRGAAAGPRAVRYGPAPSGNAAVRGQAARPSHRPRPPDEAPERPTRETDEWRFLGSFVRWSTILVLTAVIGLALAAAVLAGDASEPPSVVPAASPGGDGFCRTPDGWISCRLVEVREP